MRTIDTIGAQGDVIFVRVDSLPEGTKVQPEAEEYVVAHSETGHHHVARSRKLRLHNTEDPLVSYLEMFSNTRVRHLRSYDTHEAVELLAKIDEVIGDASEPTYFRVARQRQMTPEGWTRVVD